MNLRKIHISEICACLPFYLHKVKKKKKKNRKKKQHGRESTVIITAFCYMDCPLPLIPTNWLPLTSSGTVQNIMTYVTNCL